jgi:hypothetical protein
MNRRELLNLLQAAFRSLDEQEAAIRTVFARARDRIHDRIVELLQLEPSVESTDNGPRRAAMNRPR